MLTVKIEDSSVEVVSVNGRNGTFQARRQKGWVTLPNGERRQIRLRVNEGQQYMPGEYVIDDKSFVVSQYGDLQLGALVLVPVRAAAARPAA